MIMACFDSTKNNPADLNYVVLFITILIYFYIHFPRSVQHGRIIPKSITSLQAIRLQVDRMESGLVIIPSKELNNVKF
jgi:hypothetical protein